MSELIDLRAKITPETDKYLDAISKATGEDRAVIVRHLLHEIAIRKIDEIRIAYAQLKSKGMTGD